jgi:transposase-like protein
MTRRKKGSPSAPAAGGERSEPEAAGAGARGRPGRRTAAERKEAVLQLLSGKASVDQLARRFGVRPETVEGWRQTALEALEEVFRQGSSKSAREQELERDRVTLEKVVTRLTMKNELMERALKEFPRKPGRSR